jgi:sugar phosphate permease
MVARAVGGRIHYAWLVVGVTFVVMLAAAGVRSIPGVLFLPLEGEFGWTRAAISLAVSINIFLFGLCGPFAAALMERIGMRRMMVASLTLLALSALASTRMSQLWQLHLLWGVTVGLGTGAMAGWVAATVANRWFVERRGLVVGALTAANATGQLIFLPIIAWVTEQQGWRAAVLLPAFVALVVIPLVWLVIRSYPADVGQRAYGAGPDDLPVPPITGGNPFVRAVSTLTNVMRHRDFLLLAGTFFVCGASTNGLIGTHLIPASIEHGIPDATAAGFLAVIGVFDVIGTMISGWLSDRYDNRWLLVWYYSLRGLSLLFLPYAYDSGYFGLAVFVVFYGLDWVATVPPTVRLAADIFGKQNVGRIFAWVSASHQLGAAMIAFGAGATRTWLGDYQAAFMFSGVLCLIAAGMAIRIGRESRVPAPVPAAG